MRNPSRRNRNSGTARQGHGQRNRLTIPQSDGNKAFYECLGPVRRTEQTINGHRFVFLVEALTPGYQHPCSVADLARVIGQLPAACYGQLRFIVLRQPTRKQTVLSPVWGRLIYWYEFGADSAPAIILEAVEPNASHWWRRGLSVADQQELRRLASLGLRIEPTARHHHFMIQPATARSVQLYHTLLHEFGHYQHYLQVVEWPARPDEAFEAWQQRHAQYFRLPGAEKEQFAHAFADRQRQRLQAAGLIPFAPLP